MAYELIIIGGGILFSVIGFIIGIFLIRRAYKQSPSILHYKKIIDILTLRKLHNKLYTDADTVSGSKKSKTGEDHIEHYEDMRDKLTIRKKPQEVEVSGGSGGMIGNLIGGFVAILVGVALLGPVAQQVGQASQQMQMNVTTPSSEMAATMLKMLPAFFIIAILGVAIAVAYGALRNSGMV